MGRDAMLAAERDHLWLAALRLELLRIHSGEQLAAARRLARTIELEQLPETRRRTVVPFVRWRPPR